MVMEIWSHPPDLLSLGLSCLVWRDSPAPVGTVRQAVETACTGLSTNNNLVFASGPLLWRASKGAAQSLTGLRAVWTVDTLLSSSTPHLMVTITPLPLPTLTHLITTQLNTKYSLLIAVL